MEYAVLMTKLGAAGLALIRNGKVRDTFSLPGFSGLLLSLVSDRLSIFDFVLPASVPDKGAVLNAVNIFWRTGPLKDAVEHDLVAFGADIDRYLPESLRGLPELQKRATVVVRLDMVLVEAVVRGYLTGSGLKSYRNSGTVCGHALPPGLRDGDRLSAPIFTPTTKAPVGEHDLPLDVHTVRTEPYGAELEGKTLELFGIASAYAGERGIIIVDSKLEWGHVCGDLALPGLVLGDESFTPDASRFWLTEDWHEARLSGRSPKSSDKQVARDWGAGVGIDKLDPASGHDCAYVHSLAVPPEILEKTSAIYRALFERLVGQSLAQFQRGVMKIVP